MKRNSDIFNKLFHDYYTNLSRFAFTYVKDEAVAEELVQEVFVNLWQKQELKEISSIRSFLYISVRNRALNYLRDHKTRTLHENDFAIERERDALYEYNEYEHKQLETLVKDAIAELPEKCREIFELSRNENLTYQQIAEQLNISTKTVENQISIAIKKLRVKLKDYMSFFATFF